MRLKNRWKLYELINKKPNHSITEYSTIIGWNRKKTIKVLERLHKEGMIKMIFNRYYPTPWQELIDWEEFNKDVK